MKEETLKPIIAHLLDNHPDFSESLIRHIVIKQLNTPIEGLTNDNAHLFTDAFLVSVEFTISSIKAVFDVGRIQGSDVNFNLIGVNIDIVNGIFTIV